MIYKVFFYPTVKKKKYYYYYDIFNDRLLIKIYLEIPLKKWHFFILFNF